MIRKAFTLLGLACTTGIAARAQVCITDEVNNRLQRQHPEIGVMNQQLEREIAENILLVKPAAQMRGTGVDTDTTFMTIPVVVHIIHDYGSEYVSDDKVYQMMDALNATYSKMNTAELAGVIPTFVPYIGNMRLRFRLATKDPAGNPTHGITRRRSYLTVGGDDQAKLDYWPQDKYLNIWFERVIGLGSDAGGIVAAYSMVPASAAFFPYNDGLISNYQFMNSGNTIAHEIGHYLNLSHPWGSNNSPGVSCGDDGVADTPPTKGQFGGCPVYEGECAAGYMRNGIDYSDTSNVQNIMNYADCDLMFTQGQKERSRAALRSNVASRSNLWSVGNVAATGADALRPALPPIADFSNTRVFGCAGLNNFTFTNRSWNDTLNSISWSLSSSASAPAGTTNTHNSSFADAGWAMVSLTANGKNGSSTVSRQAVYVASPNATAAAGYYGEFAPGTDADQYPAFDYYETGRKWELANNAGVYDSYSMRYLNKDTRTGLDRYKGTPDGDYADFFTPAFNITDAQFAPMAKLTFFTAGAYRTSSATLKNDRLEVTYSIDCGNSWRVLDSVTGADIGNNATQSTDFTPSGAGQWKLREITLPAAARAARVFFRFRYRPGVNQSSNEMAGTGNNFYIDRINITSNPTAINEQELAAEGIALAPNPTTGSAWVMLSSATGGEAQVQVTDIAGKVVYRTSQQTQGNARIEIPATAIPVKGLYLVQVLTGSRTFTKKLVVY